MYNLKKFLTEHGVDWSTWGQGASREIEHLFQELEEDASELLPTPDGQLIRRNKGVRLTIYCFVDGQRYRLYEDKQVFADGRERQRDQSFSLGEKCRRHENIFATAFRAIKEELDIWNDEGIILYNHTQTTTPLHDSQSYPGLQSQFIVDSFDVQMPPRLFKPEGYVEKQREKTSYFIWKKVTA
jgi:hypothetical protein